MIIGPAATTRPRPREEHAVMKALHTDTHGTSFSEARTFKKHPRRSILIAALALVSIAVAGTAGAQTIRTDTYVTNGLVFAEALSGNTLYIAGEFSSVGPPSGAGAPLNATTGVAVSGYPKVAGEVYCVAPDGSGGWFIGGQFYGVDGISRTNLAHILSNNTVATWNPAPNGAVFSLFADGSTLYVGGSFSVIGGQARSGIAAIDVSSGGATTWNPTSNGTVHALQVSAGVVYAGGSFSSIGGSTRNNIAALDAGTGLATSWDPNSDGVVTGLAVSGTTIYASGGFNNIGSLPRNFIAALDSGTGLANALWNPNSNNFVNTLALSGSVLYAGGSFTNIGLQNRNFVAALDVSSGLATTWDPNANSDVLSLAVNGGTVFAGGAFTNIGGQSRTRIAGIDAGTGNATAFSTNPNDVVFAVAASGSVVYAGGIFSSLAPTPRNNIAALDLTTGQVTSWNPNANGRVLALSLGSGVLYAGGAFSNIGGQNRNFIAALDPGTGAATGWDPSADNQVLTIDATAGVIYAGGDFGHIGGQDRSFIAALDPATGAAAPLWDPSADNEVDVIVEDGGVVYAGGFFNFIGGQTRLFAAGLDSVTGLATNWDPSADNQVQALVVTPSVVYAGGGFQNIGGETRNGIAALNRVNGHAILTWDPNANGTVSAIAFNNGVVYAGGSFQSIGGEPHLDLAALDAGTGLATSWRADANASVLALIASGTSVYAAGAFEALDLLPQTRLGVIDEIVPPPQNAVLTINDISVPEGNSGTTPATFTVTVTPPVSHQISVNYTTVNGVALAPGDYAAKSGTLVIPANAPSGPITVNINGDTKYENNEPFYLRLSSPSGASFGDSVGTCTIVNDDPLPSISINDTSVVEGNSGTRSMVFTVRLSNPTYAIVRVGYATQGVSATTSDNDYVGKSGTLSINPGDVTGTISVTVNGDTKSEPDETFNLNLSSPEHATIADGQGIGTIKNDDGSTPPPSTKPVLSINDVSKYEGNRGKTPFVFTISLSFKTASQVSVNVATSGITAKTSDYDYVGVNTTVNIPANTLSVPFTVYVNGDKKKESDEKFAVNLSSPTNATIGDGQGIGTIKNDDGTSHDVATPPVAAEEDSIYTGEPDQDGAGALPGEDADLALWLAPNPTPNALSIDFAMPTDGDAHVTVIDVLGRQVAEISSGFAEAGAHHVSWDGRVGNGAATPGLYFVRLETAGRVVIKRFARL
jgi:hypothetical protein